MFWSSWAALLSALLASLGLTNFNPLTGVVLYFLFKEGSEMLMALHLAYGEDDGANSY